MIACPNVHSPEWIDLVETVGDSAAWEIYNAKGEIPLIATSVEQVKTKHKLTDPRGNDLLKKVSMTDRIQSKYLNVEVSSELVGDKLYSHTVNLVSLKSPAFYNALYQNKLGSLDNAFPTMFSKVSSTKQSMTESPLEAMVNEKFKQELEQPLKRLEGHLKSIIQSIDPMFTISVKKVLKDRYGNPININGSLEIVRKLIQVSKDRNALVLPEEVFHAITLWLDPNDPRMKQMMEDIVYFKRYAEVKRDYVDEYGTNEALYRLEAIAKVLADNAVKQELIFLKREALEDQAPAGVLKRFYKNSIELLRRILRAIRLISPEKLAEIQDDYNKIFKEFVDLALYGDIEGLIGEQDISRETLESRIYQNIKQYWGPRQAASYRGVVDVREEFTTGNLNHISPSRRLKDKAAELNKNRKLQEKKQTKKDYPEEDFSFIRFTVQQLLDRVNTFLADKAISKENRANLIIARDRLKESIDNLDEVKVAELQQIRGDVLDKVNLTDKKQKLAKNKDILEGKDKKEVISIITKIYNRIQNITSFLNKVKYSRNILIYVDKIEKEKKKQENKLLAAILDNTLEEYTKDNEIKLDELRDSFEYIYDVYSDILTVLKNIVSVPVVGSQQNKLSKQDTPGPAINTRGIIALRKQAPESIVDLENLFKENNIREYEQKLFKAVLNSIINDRQDSSTSSVTYGELSSIYNEAINSINVEMYESLEYLKGDLKFSKNSYTNMYYDSSDSSSFDESISIEHVKRYVIGMTDRNARKHTFSFNRNTNRVDNIYAPTSWLQEALLKDSTGKEFMIFPEIQTDLRSKNKQLATITSTLSKEVNLKALAEFSGIDTLDESANIDLEEINDLRLELLQLKSILFPIDSMVEQAIAEVGIFSQALLGQLTYTAIQILDDNQGLSTNDTDNVSSFLKQILARDIASSFAAMLDASGITNKLNSKFYLSIAEEMIEYLPFASIIDAIEYGGSYTLFNPDIHLLNRFKDSLIANTNFTETESEIHTAYAAKNLGVNKLQYLITAYANIKASILPILDKGSFTDKELGDAIRGALFEYYGTRTISKEMVDYISSTVVSAVKNVYKNKPNKRVQGRLVPKSNALILSQGIYIARETFKKEIAKAKQKIGIGFARKNRLSKVYDFLADNTNAAFFYEHLVNSALSKSALLYTVGDLIGAYPELAHSVDAHVRALEEFYALDSTIKNIPEGLERKSSELQEELKELIDRSVDTIIDNYNELERKNSRESIETTLNTIRSLVENKSTSALIPTNGGKSIEVGNIYDLINSNYTTHNRNSMEMAIASAQRANQKYMYLPINSAINVFQRNAEEDYKAYRFLGENKRKNGALPKILYNILGNEASDRIDVVNLSHLFKEQSVKRYGTGTEVPFLRVNVEGFTLYDDMDSLVMFNKGPKLSNLKIDEDVRPSRPTNQLEVIDSIKSSVGNLSLQPVPSSVTGEEDEELYVDSVSGKTYAYRASEYGKHFMKVFGTKKQQQEQSESPNSIINKEVGTELHALEETFSGYYAYKTDNLEAYGPAKSYKTKPKRPSWITKDQYLNIEKDVKKRLEELAEVQRSIDPKSNAILLLEQIIHDSNDTAGTMDLFVVFSDASVGIFDYKFSHTYRLMETMPDGSIETHVDVVKLRSKRDAYHEQMTVYKHSVMQTLGIREDQFRFTRIIPGSFSLRVDRVFNEDGSRRTATNKYSTKKYLKSMTNFAIGTESTRQLSVAKERTAIKTLNKILIRLEEDRYKISIALEKRVDAIQREILNKRSQDIADLIDSIVISKGVLEVPGIISKAAANIFQTINTVSAEKLAQVHREATLYQTILAIAINHSENLTSSNSNLTVDELAALKQSLGDTSLLINNLKDYIIDKITEDASKKHEGLGNPAVEAAEEGNGLERWLKPLSEYNHPVFRAMAVNIDIALGQILQKDAELNREIQQKMAALRIYGKQNGKSLYDVYKLFIDTESVSTGNLELIKRFNKSTFWDVIHEASEKGDTVKIKSFFKYTPEGKKRYNEDRTKYITKLLLIHPKDSRDYLWRIKNWEKKNNLSRADAWTNFFARQAYAEVKSPEKYYSTEYSFIHSNTVLKEFYDWYTTKMSTWNRLMDDKISPRFVARIQKDTIDMLAEDLWNNGDIAAVGRRVKSYSSKMLGIAKAEETLKINDTDIGNMISVPLMYRSGFNPFDTTSAQQADLDSDTKVENLSMDLLYTMQMFGHAVHNKITKEAIVDKLQNLRIILENTENFVLDSRGKRDKYIGSGEYRLKTPSTKDLEVFDNFYRSYIMGERQVNVGRKIVGNLDTNDVANSLNSAAVKLGLTLNYKASVAGHFNAMAQLNLLANKGIYINRKVLNVARKIANKGFKDEALRDKYVAAVSFFGIESGNLAFRNAAKNSASWITRNLRQDQYFKFFELADKRPSDLLVISMLMNYGIDPSDPGKVNTLDQLPKNTKSLWDSLSIDKNKGNIVSVEGMDSSNYADFRMTAKTLIRRMKGTSNLEDLSRANMDAQIRLVTTFRSWAYPLYAERWGNTTYEHNLKNVDMGKYSVLFGEMWNYMQKQGVKDSLKPVGKLIINTLLLGAGGIFFSKFRDALNIKQDEEIAKQMYAKFLEAFPEAKGKVSLDRFIQTRQGQFTAVQQGMAITLLTLAILMALTGDWDDDGIPDYKEPFVDRGDATTNWDRYGNRFVRAIANPIVKRLLQEFTFFSNPFSAVELIKSPIPSISVVILLSKALINTLDEARDMVYPNDPSKDTTPIGKYVLNATPGFKNTVQFGYGLSTGLYDAMKEYVEYEQ